METQRLLFTKEFYQIKLLYVKERSIVLFKKMSAVSIILFHKVVISLQGYS